MRVFTWCLLLASALLNAGVEDHFKKAEGKSDVHSMKGIDFIYLINLDQRPEKLASCLEQLHPYEIYPCRFSAVNGWELTLEDINDVGVKFQPGMRSGFWGTSYLPGWNWEPVHDIIHEVGRTYFCHCMSRGAIGIALSHLSVLQDAYDSGYKTVWIMEDDIQVMQNPHVLSELIEELDKLTAKRGGWDVLFTDRDTKDREGRYVPCTTYTQRPNFTPTNPQASRIHRAINKKFYHIGARYGAYSMIVRRSGMKKILDFLKTYHIFLPYDMDNPLPPGIKFYSVADDVVSTLPKATSDNGGPNYKSEQ